MTIDDASATSDNEPIYGANEIDFDDDRDEDQYPLDEVEAAEAGALLDDPEALDEDG